MTELWQLWVNINQNNNEIENWERPESLFFKANNRGIGKELPIYYKVLVNFINNVIVLLYSYMLKLGYKGLYLLEKIRQDFLFSDVIIIIKIQKQYYTILLRYSVTLLQMGHHLDGM